MGKPDDMHELLVAAIPNLRAFAISLCSNSHLADDLVQETLVRAWAHRSSFCAGTNLKAWLFTILRNAFFTEYRRAQREVLDVDGKYAGHLVTPPDQLGCLALDDFLRALNQLPPDQREVLILVGAEGFSYKEAASICGCAVGTVKSRVSRARLRLAEVAWIGDQKLDTTLLLNEMDELSEVD